MNRYVTSTRGSLAICISGTTSITVLATYPAGRLLIKTASNLQNQAAMIEIATLDILRNTQNLTSGNTDRYSSHLVPSSAEAAGVFKAYWLQAQCNHCRDISEPPEEESVGDETMNDVSALNNQMGTVIIDTPSSTPHKDIPTIGDASSRFHILAVEYDRTVEASLVPSPQTCTSLPSRHGQTFITIHPANSDLWGSEIISQVSRLSILLHHGPKPTEYRSYRSGSATQGRVGRSATSRDPQYL